MRPRQASPRPLRHALCGSENWHWTPLVGATNGAIVSTKGQTSWLYAGARTGLEGPAKRRAKKSPATFRLRGDGSGTQPEDCDPSGDGDDQLDKVQQGLAIKFHMSDPKAIACTRASNPNFASQRSDISDATINPFSDSAYLYSWDFSISILNFLLLSKIIVTLCAVVTLRGVAIVSSVICFSIV